MSSSISSMMKVGIGLAAVGTVMAIGAGAFAVEKFKEEQHVVQRHTGVRPPMYLIAEDDDTLTMAADNPADVSKLLQHQRSFHSNLELGDDWQYFEHPCSNKTLKFTSTSIPVKFHVHVEPATSKCRVEIQLDLANIFIESISSTDIKGNFYVFQDFQQIQSVKSRLDGKQETMILLSVENYWFPQENFKMYLLFRYELVTEEPIFIQCSDAHLDFLCSMTAKAKQDNESKMELKNIKAGSAAVVHSDFNADDSGIVHVQSIPVLSLTHRGKFHLAISISSESLHYTPFVVESMKDRHFVFVIHDNKPQAYQVFIDQRNKIQMKRSKILHLESFPFQQQDFSGISGITWFATMADGDQEFVIQYISKGETINNVIQFASKQRKMKLQHVLKNCVVTTEINMEETKISSVKKIESVESTSSSSATQRFFSWLKGKQTIFRE